MTQRDITEFLEHHGVKGMKWGIRRKRSSSSSSGVSDSARIKQEAKTLSDAELKARVSRMQLEKQYRDLASPTGGKKEKTRGQRFVSRLLDTPGEIAIQVARDQAVKVMSAKLEPMVKKKFGI